MSRKFSHSVSRDSYEVERDSYEVERDYGELDDASSDTAESRKEVVAEEERVVEDGGARERAVPASRREGEVPLKRAEVMQESSQEGELRNLRSQGDTEMLAEDEQALMKNTQGHAPRAAVLQDSTAAPTDEGVIREVTTKEIADGKALTKDDSGTPSERQKSNVANNSLKTDSKSRDPGSAGISRF